MVNVTNIYGAVDAKESLIRLSLNELLDNLLATIKTATLVLRGEKLPEYSKGYAIAQLNTCVALLEIINSNKESTFDPDDYPFPGY